MRIPIDVPSTVPRPPKMLVPPSTTPVITCRASWEWPEMVVVEKRVNETIPASPASAPLRAYSLITCRLTLMPARRADSMFEPMR